MCWEIGTVYYHVIIISLFDALPMGQHTMLRHTNSPPNLLHCLTEACLAIYTTLW